MLKFDFQVSLLLDYVTNQGGLNMFNQWQDKTLVLENVRYDEED
jgi:hypothetical protein